MLPKGPYLLFSPDGDKGFASYILGRLSENEDYIYEASADGRCIAGFVTSKETEYPAVLTRRSESESITVFDGFLFDGDVHLFTDEEIHHRYIDSKSRFINGMFSCIQYSNDTVRILSDPWGSQPLYFSADADTVVVSPSFEIIRAFTKSGKQFSTEGLSQYLSFGVILTHHTIYEGIYKVQRAELVELPVSPRMDSAISRFRYFTPVIEPVSRRSLYDDICSSFESALRKVHALSHSSVFFSLSGGFDSRVIAAVASRINPDYHYVTHFTDAGGVDAQLAKRCAEALRLNHSMLQLPTEYHVGDYLPDFASATNNMITYDNIHAMHAYRSYRGMGTYMVDGNHTSIEGRWFLRNTSWKAKDEYSFFHECRKTLLKKGYLDFVDEETATSAIRVADDILRSIVPDPRQYSSAGACADVFNIDYLLPSNNDDMLGLQHHYARYCTPYYDREYVKHISMLPDSARWKQKPQNTIIQRYAPDIYKLPRCYSDIETYASANPYILRIPVAVGRILPKIFRGIPNSIACVKYRRIPSIVYDICFNEHYWDDYSACAGVRGEACFIKAGMISSMKNSRRISTNNSETRVLHIMHW